MLRIETALLGVAILLAWAYPRLGSRWFEAAERRFSALAQRRALAVVLVGTTALALRLAVLPVEPIPEPIVHDEFGYLLAADTFAHGRLTNPTPPMWQHFETFSILMKPTYQCFAQPGQGMMLALGKVVFGHPFWGVWLSCGLMCAAITWMLQGWIGPEWALLGGILAILRYGVFGYWADSYWGGAVAAIGGALALGALPRIKKSQRIRDAVIMGVGLAILADTRPFEGFVLSLPIAVVLIAWLLGKKSPCLKITVPRVVIPLTLVLAVTAAGLGYYLWRVTGSAFRMPYKIEQQTYAVAPYFIWQAKHPEPVYHNPVIRKMYVEEAVLGYELHRTPVGFFWNSYVGWSYFLGPALTLPILLLTFSLPRNLSWRDVPPQTMLLLAILVVCIVGWNVESFYNPHYSAPTTGLILLLILLSMRQIRKWRGSRGLFLVRSILLICVICFGLRVAASALRIPMRQFYEFAWYQQNQPAYGRAEIKSKLEKLPDAQLVIVHYGAEHKPFEEWVYNDFDPQHAKIVWARELPGVSNEALIHTFSGRQVWMLDADGHPPKLLPYHP